MNSPLRGEGILLTNFLTVADVDRSRTFYADILGRKVLRMGEPTFIRLANSWVTLNAGGGPTDDKPDVVLAPPSDPGRASSFMNIRVADIAACYRQWSSKGARFLTPTKDHGGEIRCYMRDPDGYLIEVGQATGILAMFEE